MARVVYRGDVAELVGQAFDVPSSVLSSNQAGAWIESQWREEQARKAADAESERRQQELLAARLEQQRAATAAAMQQEAVMAERGQLEADLKAELSELSQSVVAAAAAIAGRGEAEAAARADWEQRHETLVGNAEVVIAEAKAQVQFAEASTQAGLDAVKEQLAVNRQQVADLSSELREEVSQLIGPQGERGERGLAGAGVGYCDADPTRLEIETVGKRFYGRAVVPGDLLLQRTKDALLVWRSPDGKGWQQVDEVVNKQELVSQQLAVSDHSTRVFPTVSTAVGGGSGGSGIVVPIAPSVITKNASTPFIDTSRFQAGGFDSFTSGIIMLELTPTTGTFAGNRSSLAGAFQLLAGTPDPFRYTEFANLGNLFNGAAPLVDVQFDGRLGTPTAPAGLGISIAPGSKPATTLFVSINSGEASHTTFLLRGDVIFNQDPAGTAAATTAINPKQPAWQMI